MKQTSLLRDDIKISNELSKYKRRCKCGHVMVFYKTSKRNKIICTHCGRYIYKSDFEEFKEKFLNTNKNIPK